MLGGRHPACQTLTVLATRTFLFADLRDYTAFVERHGDAAATTLIADYRRIVRAELARHEGGEIKTEGDSFYVVFTNTGSAVTCAAAILRAADAYSRDRPDRAMRIGVGIHAGEPVAHEGQFVGTAVIVAARLAQNAKAGELLVTEVVRALLPRSQTLPMTERTGLVLKGLDDPPKVFSVDWQSSRPVATVRAAAQADTAIAAASPVSQQVLCPVIIGRDRELATLEEQLAEAIAGRGRAVLLSGEAGLGKSALLRRFVARAREHDARVITGECTEIEARRPFGPFIDAFTGGDLALPSELAQGGPGALPVAEVERYRVHLAFAERLADAARMHPIVVVIEDLHWADEATNELVPYLARKLRDARVLLLITYRSDELHRLHPLNHVLAELGRGRLAEDIRLKRLTVDEVGEVIQAALGLSGPPTPAFRQALFERTEGNPFFVEEILRALVEKGELSYRDGAWHREKEVADLTIPASVRDAVQQRLLGLEPRARKAMQVAAVIGQRFDFELLGAVSGFDEATLLDAIKAAIDAQLVREETDADGNEVYIFRHALSREAVLTELLQRERRLLHRAVGNAIEALAGTAAGGRVEELAYHFDQARDPRAFSYHEQAATESTRASAFSRAAYHLERAIELAPDDEPRLGELQLKLADQAWYADELPKAIRAAEQAVATFEAAGNELGAGEAVQRLASLRWYFGETDRAWTMIQEAIARLEPLGESAALARCYGEASRLAMLGERGEEARRLGEKAADMARRMGALDVEVAAYNTVGTVIASGGADEGFTLLRKSLAMSIEHGFVAQAQRAYNNLMASTMRLDYHAAAALQAEAAAYSARHGVRPDVFVAREILFRMNGDGADWDTAVALQRSMAPGTIWWHARFIHTAIVPISRDGPREDVFAEIERGRARLRAAGDPQWQSESAAAAPVYFIAGRYAEGLVAADAGVEGAATVRYGMLARASAHLLAAALERGDAGTIERWTRTLLERPDAAWAMPPARAYARAVLARQAGDGPGATAHYREAITLAAQLPPLRLTILGQSLLGLAEIEAAAGHGDEAAQAFAQVHGSWRAMRATWYLGELERWAAERGIAAGPPA